MTTETPGIERVRRHLTLIGAASLCRFKDRYLERRLQSRCRARGVADLDAYADLLDGDPEEGSRLLSAVALGVTSFFRNPSAWRSLAHLLTAERRPPSAECRAPSAECRAWSAACATGEEAWSLAFLLDGLTREGRLPGWGVDATDLDPRSLGVARHAEYSDRCLADIEAVITPVAGGQLPGRFVVPMSLRPSVQFSVADISVPAIRGPYDIVLCRNVLMYFDFEAQRAVMNVAISALRIGGLLMLGKAELAPLDLPRLEWVDRHERIYRRTG